MDATPMPDPRAMLAMKIALGIGTPTDVQTLRALDASTDDRAA